METERFNWIFLLLLVLARTTTTTTAEQDFSLSPHYARLLFVGSPANHKHEDNGSNSIAPEATAVETGASESLVLSAVIRSLVGWF